MILLTELLNTENLKKKKFKRKQKLVSKIYKNVFEFLTRMKIENSLKIMKKQGYRFPIYFNSAKLKSRNKKNKSIFFSHLHSNSTWNIFFSNYNMQLQQLLIESVKIGATSEIQFQRSFLFSTIQFR